MPEYYLFKRGRREKRGFAPLRRPAFPGEESERGLRPLFLFYSPLQPINIYGLLPIRLAGEG
jgi:hypothetical protein